ncbi:DUF6907 domain-containing protein [Streptomyces sp. MT206]|uniref:DUF6907 domain-containing protein n=1 Tax=Streptomyces sp. MT206 TaxID=3031407 RepID=UPI002FCADBA4
MSSTVPADLPRMFRPEPKLAAVPVQPTAKNREALPVAPPARTWSFIDSTTSQLREVTCLPGCVVNHSMDQETPTHPTDVWCMAEATTEAWIPMEVARKYDDHRVLSADIRQIPFSNQMHERVPHAIVEVVEDEFVGGLDPDGLASLILTFEGQLAQMRAMHARLVELREQGRVQL